jgi:uncharacterized protein (UPF0333 family)
MKKQQKQMVILVIVLILLIGAYFAISHFAKNMSTTDDGPNAEMGNVTESLLEDTEDTETAEATETDEVTETVDGTEP